MTALEGLRRRIESVEELASIVRTMKVLAAVQMHAYERAARRLTRFDETVELGFQVLLRRLPLERVAPTGGAPGRIAAVVLGTDQGMCGAFNDRIVSFARRWFEEGREVERGPVLVVGRRAADLLAETELAPEVVLAAPSSAAAVTALVEELLVRLEAWRAAERFDRLFVFHNRRGVQRRASPQLLQHLPLPATWLHELASRPWAGPSLPATMLDPDVLLHELLHQRLFGSLYRAAVESLDSENLSRLDAMQSAQDNIAELLDVLRDAFRHERQAAITAELLDIVSGYETTRGVSAGAG